MTTSSDPTSKPPVRPFDTGLVLGEGFAMLGIGFAGAWLASFANYLLDRTFFPERLGDGQYAFTFILSIPIGWVAGTCLYGLVRSRAEGFTRKRELIAALWTANAALVVLCLPLLPVVAISLGLVIQALGLKR